MDPRNERLFRSLSTSVLFHAIFGNQQRGNYHQQFNDEQWERGNQQRPSNEQPVASKNQHTPGERWFHVSILSLNHFVDERKRVQHCVFNHVDANDRVKQQFLDREATDRTQRG